MNQTPKTKGSKDEKTLLRPKEITTFLVKELKINEFGNLTPSFNTFYKKYICALLCMCIYDFMLTLSISNNTSSLGYHQAR